MTPLTDPNKFIAVYTVEGSDAIHLTVCGVNIGAYGPFTDKGMALLKLDAAIRPAPPANREG